MSEKPTNDALGNIPTPADFFGWLNQIMTPMTQATTAFASNIPTPADPLTMWRNYTEKNEEIYSKFLQQLVSTPAFAQTLGRSTSASARYREMVKQAAKIYLETADMPSREDVTRVAAQVVALDAKVDDLSDSLSDNLTEMPRLLKTVVATLEMLATRLELLENKVSQQSLNLESLAPRLAGVEAQFAQSNHNTEEVKTQLESIEKQLSQNSQNFDLLEKLAKLESQLSGLEAKLNAPAPTTSPNVMFKPETDQAQTPDVIFEPDTETEPVASPDVMFKPDSQGSDADNTAQIELPGVMFKPETETENAPAPKRPSRSRKKPNTTTEPITES